MSAYRYARDAFLAMLVREDMLPTLSGGALVALSGGKDSVLLLSLAAAYAREEGIPLSAMHLHHGIRGEEADRDAAFCRALCERLDVPFVLMHADVPSLAKARGEGLEETARNERYRALTQAARERGYTAILTAHTASDNAETVLFQLLRGGGTRALCGIPPKREAGEGLTLLRPLLSLSAEEVLAALAAAGLPYVTDSTNTDTLYARNYLREEILPRLSHLTPSPARAITRMTENVREDAALLDAMARTQFDTLYTDASLCAEGFFRLPHALRFRVLRLFYDTCMAGHPLPTRAHVRALDALVAKNGAISMPGGVTITRADDRLFFGEDAPFVHPNTPIHMGCNRLADGSYLFLLDESTTPPPPIVYTLSIRRDLVSAKIEGELTVRSREAGDAYRYGGMTHKLKKMFSDKKIPQALRSRIPVLCDGRGIVWVPSFGVREDDLTHTERRLTVLYLASDRVTDEIARQLSAPQE